jgi:hypothetical protein
LDLDESVELSVEASLLGAFSVLASVFFVVLLVESASAFVESALLFFSLVLFLSLVLVLFEDGLVALSDAGLFVAAGLFVVDDLVEGDADDGGLALGTDFAVALADAAGAVVGATDAEAAGVMVAPTLAVAAGVALASVEPVTFVVVPVVAVVPVVDVTPTLKLGVTP